MTLHYVSACLLFFPSSAKRGPLLRIPAPAAFARPVQQRAGRGFFGGAHDAVSAVAEGLLLERREYIRVGSGARIPARDGPAKPLGHDTHYGGGVVVR